LTVKGLARLTAPGRYPDGNTLYLFVQHSGARSWVQRLVVDGRRRDIGLGSAKYVTLAQARQQAYENRVAARRGGDPFACTPQHRIPTFRVACDKAAQGRQWKGRSSEARRVALESYARSLMDRRVDRIGREDVLRCLLPIWTAKAATARKVRSWIRAALAWAQAHGHVEINYAGEAIAGALPVVKTNRDHHTALPYGEVGAALQAIDASAAASNVKGCLKFAILTAVRSGEARGARWSEIDMDAREWRIPAQRMKVGEEHRVPLSDAALAIVEAQASDRGSSDYVFASPQPRGQGNHRRGDAGQADQASVRGPCDGARLQVIVPHLGVGADERHPRHLRNGAGASCRFRRGAVLRPLRSVRQAACPDECLGSLRNRQSRRGDPPSHLSDVGGARSSCVQHRLLVYATSAR
jgi:integrase